MCKTKCSCSLEHNSSSSIFHRAYWGFSLLKFQYKKWKQLTWMRKLCSSQYTIRNLRLDQIIADHSKLKKNFPIAVFSKNRARRWYRKWSVPVTYLDWQSWLIWIVYGSGVAAVVGYVVESKQNHTNQPAAARTLSNFGGPAFNLVWDGWNTRGNLWSWGIRKIRLSWPLWDSTTGPLATPDGHIRQISSTHRITHFRGACVNSRLLVWFIPCQKIQSEQIQNGKPVQAFQLFNVYQWRQCRIGMAIALLPPLNLMSEAQLNSFISFLYSGGSHWAGNALWKAPLSANHSVVACSCLVAVYLVIGR